MRNVKDIQSIASLLKTLRESGSSALVILLGRIGIILAQIISVRISTELLSPAQMGGVSQLGSLAYFFNMLLVIPVHNYMVRGFLDWHDTGQLRGNIKHYFTYIFIIAIVTAFIAWGVQAKWQLVSGFGAIAVALLIGLYIGTSPFSGLGTTGLNLINKRGMFVIFANLSVWLALFIAPVMFIYYNNAAFWALGQYSGTAISCLSIWILWRLLKVDVIGSSSEPKRVLPFSVLAVFGFAYAQVITSVLWWIQSQSYRFILDRIQGATMVGLFTVGYSLAATPIAMYEGLFGQFYEPIYFGELKGQGEEGLARAWNNYARAYLPGVLVVGAYVAAGAPFLAQLLIGEQYRSGAIKVAFWAVIIEIMRAPGAMIHFLGIAKVDMRILIAPVCAGAILAPICVLFLGQFDPLLGTVAGLLIAGFTAMTIGIAISKKFLPVTWPVRRIMVGFVLSIPLALGFQFAYWMVPSPGLVFSIFMLVLGGVYLIVALVWLFGHRDRCRV